MREILYKGKRVDNGEWVISDSIMQDGDKVFLWAKDSAFVQVIPETGGEYTGLKDKNGKRIFEGDILYIGRTNEYAIVKFNRGWFYADSCAKRYNSITVFNEVFVAGNIHDNPELLQEDAQ